MTAAETLRTDPVFNDPPPTTIDGLEYVIREIKYRQLRSLGMGFVEFLLGAAEKKTPASLVEAQLDKATQFVEDSTGVPFASFENFPASHSLRLFNAVLEAHRPVLNEIFRARHQIVGLLVPPKNGLGSDPPNSSSP